MTIDEAIQRYDDDAEYERTHGNLQGWWEFNQLVKWLKELKQKPCEDCISREKVLGCFEFPNTKRKDFIEAIKKLPPETPTRKKGKWLNKDASGYHFYGKCSECGQEFCVDAWYTQNMKFCPNCGAESEG